MNTTMLSRAARLSNQDLVARVKELARTEREATAILIAHLAVLDERRLYLAEGCSSLFTYCTQVLHLSEYAAYGRIEAARAARKFPIILAKLSDGAVNLTTVTLLAPHLTPDNHRTILEAATHKPKREVEELVAQLRPQPPVPSLVRKLPNASLTVTPALPPEAGPSRSAGVGAAAGEMSTLESGALESGNMPSSGLPMRLDTTRLPTRQTVIEPLAPQQYRVQFTASAETYGKLQLAQDLLRHQIPDGDVGLIMDRALAVLLEALAKQKFAATKRPSHSDRSNAEQSTRDDSTRDRVQALPLEEHDRGNGQDQVGEHSERSSAARLPAEPLDRGGNERPEGHRGPRGHSRHIPADVKRRVWLRDGGRCAFVAANGRRCTERAFLEFHHVEPYCVGGEATVENIELRCRAHNGYEAEFLFGPWVPPRGRLTTAAKEAPTTYERFADSVRTCGGSNPSETLSRLNGGRLGSR